jgi:hypothetical protein
MPRSSHQRSCSGKKRSGQYKKSWIDRIEGLADLIGAFDRLIKALTELLISVLRLVIVIFLALSLFIHKA